MQDLKAFGSSWIEELVPWSPQLPNKPFSFVKPDLEGLQKTGFPGLLPEPALPAGPRNTTAAARLVILWLPHSDHQPETGGGKKN